MGKAGSLLFIAVAQVLALSLSFSCTAAGPAMGNAGAGGMAGMGRGVRGAGGGSGGGVCGDDAGGAGGCGVTRATAGPPPQTPCRCVSFGAMVEA